MSLKRKDNIHPDPKAQRKYWLMSSYWHYLFLESYSFLQTGNLMWHTFVLICIVQVLQEKVKTDIYEVTTEIIKQRGMIEVISLDLLLKDPTTVVERKFIFTGSGCHFNFFLSFSSSRIQRPKQWEEAACHASAEPPELFARKLAFMPGNMFVCAMLSLWWWLIWFLFIFHCSTITFF